MSFNLHELETKGNCRCLTLGGNTFIALPQPSANLFSVQINQDKNFAVYFGFSQETDVITSVYTGKWKCCKNLFVGVALQSVPNSSIYKRLTLEIDPTTLFARYRILILEYQEGDCLSSMSRVVSRTPITTVNLQPIVSNCGADFIDPVEPQ